MAKRFGQVEKDLAKFQALLDTGTSPSVAEAEAILTDLDVLKPVLDRFVARAANKDEETRVYGPKMQAKVRA